MGVQEEKTLGERVAVVEALLEAHEKGALIRKQEISGALKEIFDKLNGQQCAVHAVNMIALRSDVTKLTDVTVPKLDTRLSWLERVTWTGFGALTVIIAVLKWVLK
jgi:hypothetical protein